MSDKFIQPEIIIVSRKEKTDEEMVSLLSAALAAGDKDAVMKLLEQDSNQLFKNLDRLAEEES